MNTPHTSLKLYISVDVACSCEITLVGDNAPPSFIQEFNEAMTGHRTDFVDLTPNSQYIVTVRAFAPTYSDNSKSQSKLTDPPFPVLTKFQFDGALQYLRT